MYDLQSIVVHSGSATGGHYFSYCNTRDGWYSFNDGTCRKCRIGLLFFASSLALDTFLLIFSCIQTTSFCFIRPQ